MNPDQLLLTQCGTVTAEIWFSHLDKCCEIRLDPTSGILTDGDVLLRIFNMMQHSSKIPHIHEKYSIFRQIRALFMCLRGFCYTCSWRICLFIIQTKWTNKRLWSLGMWSVSVVAASFFPCGRFSLILFCWTVFYIVLLYYILFCTVVFCWFLCVLFYVLFCCLFYWILFNCFMFCFAPFCPIEFYSVLLSSILFFSALFYSVLLYVFYSAL